MVVDGQIGKLIPNLLVHQYTNLPTYRKWEQPVEQRNLYSFEPQPLLVVVSGPAGVGKDSLIQCLKERGCPLHSVVTATDRAPRPGEVHGVDYFFLRTEEFLRMKREGELLEHAIVYGQHKGIPKQQVREALASGKDVIMRVDVQGAATVRRLVPEALLIFLTASSEKELEERLRDRDDVIAIIQAEHCRVKPRVVKL